ncbi:protease B nonderepressible form [Coemansia sp. RSA 2704]|nr:protease B nonderepressible form [Coemansia sp. RSA 2704]
MVRLSALDAAATLLLALALAQCPSALSNSDMRRPEGADALLAPPPLATEDHVVFGQEVSATSSSASGNGWSFESAGSWHIWSHQSLFDNINLPLWPEAMKEARIVLSSGMCRADTARPLPPFMPAAGLEHCGSHILATARSDVPTGVPLAIARVQMRRWLAQFMGWGDAPDSVLGPAAFISLGNSSIYHFHPFAAKAINRGADSRLDLAALAVGPHHYLRTIAPQVTYRGRQWLDNYRIEAQLQRTAHGFVKLSVQAISLLPAAPEVSIEPLDNATSRIAWIGPTKDSVSFMLAGSQARPEALRLPAGLFDGAHARFLGDVTARIADFASFHPSIKVSANFPEKPVTALESCRVNTLLALPRAYFFDPYQLHQHYDDRQLDAEYQHFGRVELEKPAEAVPSWGSLLVLAQEPRQQQQLNVTVPIHARYRLPPIHEPTVGYHGEPAGTSHVDLTLPPPISAVVCPADRSQSGAADESIVSKLRIRLAVFDELGLDPVGPLQIAPDTDMLLRMPVPDTRHATLIQASTLSLLFAGALFIVHSTYQRTSLSA